MLSGLIVISFSEIIAGLAGDLNTSAHGVREPLTLCRFITTLVESSTGLDDGSVASPEYGCSSASRRPMSFIPNADQEKPRSAPRAQRTAGGKEKGQEFGLVASR